MENLKVPYGLDTSNTLVSAEHASQSRTYKCPSCNTELIYKSGNIRTKHFSHPSNSECNIESVLHKTAKLLILNAISENSTGNQPIQLHSTCQNCDIEFNTTLNPKLFSHADEEVPISKYICDVVAYRDNNIALAIEVFNTHKVDAKKAKKIPVYWIELAAEDIIKNAFYWKPTQAHLKPSLCTKCKAHIKHIYEVADRWGIDRKLYTPVKKLGISMYIADTERCFKCKNEIPVFWWKGVPFCEKEPPSPRPQTIKYRNSKAYGGAYWANICAYCKILQGDNHLFLLENAPFKRLPLAGEDSSNEHGSLTILTGDEAKKEFDKVLKRNLGF